MDHGVLNVPLSKRGDINAQLDAHKAAARKQAAADSRSIGELRKQARDSVLAMTDARMAELAASANTTPRLARIAMLSAARFDPRQVLRAAANEASKALAA